MKIMKCIGIVFVVLLIFGPFIKDEFTVTNEKGYFGMDKYGRQVLIQTLNQKYSEQHVLVDSEFSDTSFVYRLVFGQPMRTTLRIIVKDKETAKKFDKDTIKLALAQPSSVFLDLFKDGGKIYLTESVTIDGDELTKIAKRYEISTFEDLLTAFGFKKYEVYLNNELIVSITLNNKGNTIKYGGFTNRYGDRVLEFTKPGYTPPKLKADIDYLHKYGEPPPDYGE